MNARALVPLPAFVVAATLAVTRPLPVTAQEEPGDAPPPGFEPPIAGTWEPVRSLGQPRDWRPSFTLAFGLDRTGTGEAAGPVASLGAFRDFYNPVYGALGLDLQAYLGQRGGSFDGGVQALLRSPALFLHAGVDWNPRFDGVDPVLGIHVPLQRGGWPLRASQLRAEWIPGRKQSVRVGFSVPLFQPLQGRTRSRTVDVELPERPRRVRNQRPPPASTPAGDALLALQESMRWLISLHTFFWLTDVHSLDHEESIAETRAALERFRARLAARDTLGPRRDTYAGEVEFYHASLERAFGLAVGAGPEDAVAVGRPLADRARTIALEEVVLPYDRTVGQYKQPDILDGLTARARARFISWLQLTGDVGDSSRTRALGVLNGWLDGFEGLRRRMERTKKDSRTHWLPLALVLRPEEHATGSRIDALVELALDRRFSRGNTTRYIDALRFQRELSRTIHETETYHVLWIHDYRGRDGSGDPDRTGFAQTTRGYLRALLEGVRRYDRTGRLPVYILMLDQMFYEENDSRLWLDLLERPLDAEIRLPPRFSWMEDTVEALRDSLRAAVAASRRLQADTEALGPDWVEDVVKVHVNVTNPSDFTFRSRRLLGLTPPLGADNMMRDHRKIVIRDVTEREPGRGEVIFAGVGVGDLYASSSWDDRALVLRGPAALEAKAAAREVLERHRMTGRDLPVVLRPVERADDFGERVRALEADGATARVLQAHNQTGWGSKDATFLQMLLYDLAPAGTVLYVPDSVWTSYEWMSQLVGAALRGCRVVVVAPALDNAPSAGFPQMSTMQELVTRLVLVSREFGDVIRDAGGELRVGLYSRTAPLDDAPALLADLDTALTGNPFLGELFPLSDEARSVVRRRARSARASAATEPGDTASPRVPQMHRKTQLIISGELLSALSASPEMAAALRRALGEARETPGGGATDGEAGPARRHATARLPPAPVLGRAYRRLVDDGVVADPPLHFLVGSLNKNVRSMALDGEVMAAVAGPWALQAVADFVLLSGGTTWVTSVEEVEELLPPYSPFQKRIGRWLHPIL